MLISLAGADLGSLLPQLLTCLSAPIRDEDAAVRTGNGLITLVVGRIAFNA